MNPPRLASILALLTPSLLPAQQPQAPAPDDLGELLAAIRAEHGVPALGAAVLVDGRLAAIGVAGVRRVGHDAKVMVDDRWHLGSCTKAMTATLVGRLVEAGNLQWATTVAQGLPDLAAKLHEAAQPVTLQQLLQHRAGLPGGPGQPLWGRLFRYPGSLQDARTEVAATMLARAPEAKPGERFLYSNAGYMIAGAIAERAGGAAFEELLTKELFAPLGMASAGFGAPGDEQAADQPWGHRRRGDALEPVFRDNPPAMAPAGTVHCSLRDWAKFAALHLGVPTGDAGPLLSAKTLAELHAPPAGGDYALGWGVTKRPWAPGPVLTHSGSNTMWFCVAWLAPEPKFGVLVACNQGDASKACDAVAAACVGRYREAAK